MKKYRILLCGYHWAGCRILEHIATRTDISDIAVITHDPSEYVEDVREVAQRYNIWFSTKNVNNVDLPFKPDIISSVYYRYIISKKIISACDGKIFNAHPSLLPKHRGCSAVPMSIIENDEITGITYHYIDAGIDTGNIILQAAIQIEPRETQLSLYKKCMDYCVEYWPAAFELVKSGFTGIEQKGRGSYHKRGVPFEGVIQDGWTIEQVERFIRAMTFPPYPYATYKGECITLLDDYLRIMKSHVGN